MQRLPANPSLYEINTRVWLRQFDKPGRRATLADVPDTFWQGLCNRGMHIVWLMGVWRTNAAAMHERDTTGGLRDAYDAALPGWQDKDVIGSPYAVDEYVVADELGGPKALARVRQQLADYGLRLMLDFVPNHFGAASRLIEEEPGIFIRADAERDRPAGFNADFFYYPDNADELFAHGRDPFFEPWFDTVQVNYASDIARQFMIDTLLDIASQCDGVRCDMAMLVMNDIFDDTWGGQYRFELPADEFWVEAIESVQEQTPGFLFMAEAYWDREWALQQQGFDYTYDKRLTDRLEVADRPGVIGHLHADPDYQSHSVRFLENHDEPRAVHVFGRERSLAAAVVTATLPGLHFYHDGQWQGKTVRIPVQLGREPVEAVDEGLQAFYFQLLDTVNTPLFQQGEWRLLDVLPAWEGNPGYANMFAWQWWHDRAVAVVVVNFSDVTSQCRLPFPTGRDGGDIVLVDVMNDMEYRRQVEEINEAGLYIELNANKCHIFRYML